MDAIRRKRDYYHKQIRVKIYSYSPEPSKAVLTSLFYIQFLNANTIGILEADL